MPIAVEMMLDSATDALVRQTWRKLAQAGVSSDMAESGWDPHVTLGVYDDLNVSAATEQLAACACDTQQITTTLASVGVFPRKASVLFIAPIVTHDLLALHERIHRILEPLATHPWEYYQPGRWVPHCTLATDLEPERVTPAFEIARQIALPRPVRLKRIAIVRFRPVAHLSAVDLATPTPSLTLSKTD